MTPIRYEVEWNEEDIRRFLEASRAAFARAMELLATEVWANIGKEAPTDHGRLAGSFMLEQLDEFSWRIYSEVIYALFVHEGTGIYGPRQERIYPTSKQALAFTWQGQAMVLRSVAGQQPNPYADRAIEKAEQRRQEFIAQAVAEMEGAA